MKFYNLSIDIGYGEREAESSGKLGDIDSYEIEGGETKGEIL